MDALQKLTITDGLRDLMARYVRFADHQRWTDMGELFVPDISFSVRWPDGSLLVDMQGRDTIVSLLGANAGRNDVIIHHLFSSEVDVLSQDEARGVWWMEDWFTRGEPEEGQEIPEGLKYKEMRGFGYYHGTFVRTDSGWRIKELHQTRLRLDFTY